MRVSKSLPIQNLQKTKDALLRWSEAYKEVVWLDSNEHQDAYSQYEALLAVDAFTAIETEAAGAFESLKEYQQNTSDWIFGYISYDLKNDVEKLSSEGPDRIGFADLCFFQPKKLFFIKEGKLEVHYLRAVEEEMSDDLRDILNPCQNPRRIPSPSKYELRSVLTEKEYLRKVRRVQEYIHRGDIYEANFCQEFYAERAEMDPYDVFGVLNEISRPPFAAFVRLYDKYLLCASPERYIQRVNQQVISQPVKGTAKRSEDAREDRQIAELLRSDPKERAENIMIVDLVRNDLSKIAEKTSVQVKELCGVYTFNQVHQMISTVGAVVPLHISPVEILKNTFPMGSMTGAPKISAMNIIEELEESRRGLYSGGVGYIDPDGNFDFNVVIRSILYNSDRKSVSFQVGGAITAGSLPEKEYEECQLKAKALKKALGCSEKSTSGTG